MKNLLILALIIMQGLWLPGLAHAQSEDSRTKIQLTISYGGQNIVADLNAVNTSLSRNIEALTSVEAGKKLVTDNPDERSSGTLYLTMDLKKVSDDLLKVFAKKQSRFDGVITIVDTYGKNATRTIRFKQAGLYSYADQMAASSYNDAYGAASISLLCRELSINDIVIEP